MKRDFFRRFLAKDRVEQGRSNPLFPVPKKSWIRRVLPVLALPTFLICGTYLIFRFTTQRSFYINNVELSGVVTLSDVEIRSEITSFLDKRRLLFFKERHIWFLEGEKLVKDLERALPLTVTDYAIESQTLKVTVLEDVLTMAVKNRGEWTLINLDGRIIRPIEDEEVTAFSEPPFDRMPKIEIEADVPEDNSNMYLNEPVLKAFLAFHDGARSLGLTPNHFILRNKDEDWARLNLEGKSYSILFDLHKEIDNQLFMLKTVLDEYKDKDSGLSYIDVRFGNHVYVK